MTDLLRPTRRPARPPARAPRRRRPRWPTFNAAGRARRGRRARRARVGALGGETDERVLLAVALACARCGTARSCVDLAERSADAGDADDAPSCRGRTRRPGCAAAWPARSPLRRRRRGRPLRLVDGLLYLDRYWGRRSWPPTRSAAPARPRRPRRPAPLLAAARRGCSPATGTPSSAPRPRPPPRGAGPRCSPAGPAPARPPPWPGCWRCSPARHQPPAPPPLRVALAAPDRQGRRPAAGGGRRRRGAGGSPTTERARLPGSRPPPCTGCSGWRPGRRPGSGTTAPPAALRRRGRRRDVDGVADDDGPAARGGPPGRPAGAGRRPRPARVGRGRAVLARPGRRARPSGTGVPGGRSCVSRRTASRDADRRTLRRRGPRRRRRRRARSCCAPGDASVRLVDGDRPADTVQLLVLPGAPRDARPRADGRRRRGGAAPRWTSTACCARTARARSASRAGRGRSSAGCDEHAGHMPARPWYPGGRCWSPRTTTTAAVQRRHRRGRAAPGRPRASSSPRRSAAGSPRPGWATVQTAHAMTVHRSQGSQFARVTVVLPPPSRRC